MPVKMCCCCFFNFIIAGDHYIHVYWAEAPLEFSPLLGYCPGKPLPVDASKVLLTGQGAEVARATVETEFVVDGRRAGPGGCFVLHFINPLRIIRSTCLSSSVPCRCLIHRVRLLIVKVTTVERSE